MWINDGGLAPAYNVQITADAAHGLIADGGDTNNPSVAAMDERGSDSDLDGPR